jgi:hypothetical protein
MIAAVWLAVYALKLFVMATLDQPKMSIAETEYSGYRLAFLKAEAFAGLKDRPFNPATDEITRIDTVACWKRKLKPAFNNYTQLRSGKRWQFGYWDTVITTDSMFLKFYEFDGWEAVTESTIVPKTSPLLTREQNKKLIEILEE